MSRKEFTAKTKIAAWQRSGGRCEENRIAHMPNIGCGRKLHPGDIYYEHANPDGLTGEPTLENCVVLCRSCWQIKTVTYDIPQVARAKRIERGHVGIRKPRTIRAWRRFDGTRVYASRTRD